jgi:hypothetical protein
VDYAPTFHIALLILHVGLWMHHNTPVVAATPIAAWNATEDHALSRSHVDRSNAPTTAGAATPIAALGDMDSGQLEPHCSTWPLPFALLHLVSLWGWRSAPLILQLQRNSLLP